MTALVPNSEAHDIAILCGYTVVLHPPTNPAKRAWRDVPQHLKRTKKVYVARNRDNVTETASLIAAPADPIEQLRSRTWSTVRLARQRGKPVFLVLPDGTVKR